MKKNEMSGILAVLSVLVLIIPIAVSGYVHEAEIQNVIDVQGEYTIGEFGELYNGDNNVSVEYETYFPFDSTNPLGWDSNNDTAFQGFKTGFAPDSKAT